MTEISKPDFANIWANAGDVRTPANSKIDEGWTSEVPPFQWENFAQNRQDRAIVHLFQKGISVWSPTENYYYTLGGTKSYVQGGNGTIYVAVQNSIGQNPVTDTTGTYWKVSFSARGDDYSVDTGTANNYIVAYSSPNGLLVDGLGLSFKAKFSNTTASTFTPDGLATKPILGQGLQPLQGNEIIANEYNRVIYSAFHDSWILVTSVGGGVPVGTPTKGSHATNLALVQSLVSAARSAIYTNSSANILPGTFLVDTTLGSFTLTLPATPTKGDAFTFIDANNTWDINNWTLDMNGKTIENQTGPLTVDKANQQWSLFFNSTTWEFV